MDAAALHKKQTPQEQSYQHLSEYSFDKATTEWNWGIQENA